MPEDYDLIANIDAAEPTFGVQVGKVTLRTHSESACANDPACCIHKPSNHAMKGFLLNWRGDRGFMERICPHPIGHPDPDDLAFKRRTQVNYFQHAWIVHGCDGCCDGSYSEDLYERSV